MSYKTGYILEEIPDNDEYFYLYYLFDDGDQIYYGVLSLEEALQYS
jgi:hypothetical protein